MRFRKSDELNYLAGALDERMHFQILKSGNIQIRFRTKGSLPKFLKKVFGGTCFREKGFYKRFWYIVQGKRAARLLEVVLPYMRHGAKAARKTLVLWQAHKHRQK